MDMCTVTVTVDLSQSVDVGYMLYYFAVSIMLSFMQPIVVSFSACVYYYTAFYTLDVFIGYSELRTAPGV